MKNKIRDITLGLLIFFQLCSFTYYFDGLSILSIQYNILTGESDIFDNILSSSYYLPVTNGSYSQRGQFIEAPLRKFTCHPCCEGLGNISFYLYLVLLTFILFILQIM
jgi:hypothetical protein